MLVNPLAALESSHSRSTGKLEERQQHHVFCKQMDVMPLKRHICHQQVQQQTAFSTARFLKHGRHRNYYTQLQSSLGYGHNHLHAPRQLSEELWKAEVLGELVTRGQGATVGMATKGTRSHSGTGHQREKEPQRDWAPKGEGATVGLATQGTRNHRVPAGQPARRCSGHSKDIRGFSSTNPAPQK
ncbi:hypothetical protein AV530_001618 [Patagioenas fasciata monilis]|uniref:Uncharacterized protein n=1 Tax=Patagioenas fasciata monilis TaxID=372326 RepID=A0A1V4K6J3_PATFA|nr:hypothetical protein AV530_001618 [Patagioenas fasciata monilis]